MTGYLNEAYYIIKPLIPRRLQISIRRLFIQYQRVKYRDIWPINEKACDRPANWRGWPDGKKFAVVLTHDVDCEKGHDRCLDLMKLDESLGFRSSFNFVPLRYAVSPFIRRTIENHGFEVGVHGLYHDGKYYLTRNIFEKRAAKINLYLKEWHAVGYRAPAMYHKLKWFHNLAIEYDASTFDTDPFEPHSVGVGTIFPFSVRDDSSQNAYVELPYTLPQDFTLFVLLRNKDIAIWKNKLDWIAHHGGMVLINTHPDYMNFGKGKLTAEEYPVRYYADFLNYIKTKYEGQYWHALPKDVARFWKENYSNSKPKKSG